MACFKDGTIIDLTHPRKPRAAGLPRHDAARDARHGVDHAGARHAGRRAARGRHVGRSSATGSRCSRRRKTARSACWAARWRRGWRRGRHRRRRRSSRGGTCARPCRASSRPRRARTSPTRRRRAAPISTSASPTMPLVTVTLRAGQSARLQAGGARRRPALPRGRRRARGRPLPARAGARRRTTSCSIRAIRTSRDRTDDFVLIEILWSVGRSVKVKRKVARGHRRRVAHRPGRRSGTRDGRVQGDAVGELGVRRRAPAARVTWSSRTVVVGLPALARCDA